MTDSFRYSLILPDGETFDLSAPDFIVQVDFPEGMGLPPIEHDARTLAGQPGGILQGIAVQPRLVTIYAQLNGKCRSVLHTLRAKLWNALRWNRTTSDPPDYCRLRYTMNEQSVDLHVYYAGDAWGMEAHQEQAGADSVRLIAYDPYWYAETATTTPITPLSQSLTVSAIIGKINGAWNAMGNPADAVASPEIEALALSNDGDTLYVGGIFTNLAGIANCDYIAQYTISTGTWSALGIGAASTVMALCVGPDGSLYAGGSFASMGGVANTACIAKWDGTNWTALGTGASVGVSGLAFGPDGSLYVGGAFLLVGGVADTVRIAKWDGAAWSALGTGMNNSVYALTVAPDGTLYAGGAFTLAGGVADTAYIAKWNGTAWSALGTGMDADVRALKVSSDGTLYATGSFTTAGGVSANRIAKWNGVSWVPLGSGLNNTGYSLAIDSRDHVYVGGQFTTAGGVALADRVARWTGTTWTQLDVDLPGTPLVESILFSGDDLFLGFSTKGAATVSVSTDVTMTGDGEALPIFTITGPGTLQWIENVDTGRIIVFNLAINAGEIVTIDLSAGVKTITSDWRGNLLPYAAVLPLSDFAEFALEGDPVAPSGVNTILALITGTTAASEMSCEHTDAFLSADEGVTV